LVSPSAASAWTDAAVRSVEARVRIGPDATAHVTLTATVRVHGGWLEGLELAGLDPDLVLDESVPVQAVDDAGQHYEPRAEVLGEGRLQLTFRPRSPRRGRLLITLAYTTSLAQRATEAVDEGRIVRVRWGLPGWRSGLDGVGIEVLAPRGAQAGPDEALEGASVLVEREETPDGTLLRWRRAHLPRTTPWTVAVDVPSAAMIEALRSATEVASPSSRPHAPASRAPRAAAEPPFWVGVALLLSALACAKMLSVRRLAQRSGSLARSLVPIPALARGPLAVALALAGSRAGPLDARLGLGLLALSALLATYRVAVAEGSSRLGAWHPADRRWLRAALGARWLRHVRPESALDGTTALGLLVAAAWVFAVVSLAGRSVSTDVRFAASLLPLPLLASGTRLAFPSAIADRLGHLLRLARSLHSLPEGVGLSPVAHVDVRGVVQDARVRTVLDRRPRGLLRLDLVLSERLQSGGYACEPCLLVLTRAGSPAEQALADKVTELRPESSPGGRRVLRLAPWSVELLERVVRALDDCPEAAPQERGTAAPQETLRDLPAPRAVGF
jgi:hypothetical protein